MRTHKYFAIKYVDSDGRDIYYSGHNKWNDDVKSAILFKTPAYASRRSKDLAPGGRTCQVIYITLIVEDTNDLLEKELDLN
jgi:hypothetical protein